MPKPKDELKLQRAHSLRRGGQLQEAAQLYRQLVRNNATNFDALHFLGVTEAAAGDLMQAKIHLAGSLSARPPSIQFVENDDDLVLGPRLQGGGRNLRFYESKARAPYCFTSARCRISGSATPRRRLRSLTSSLPLRRTISRRSTSVAWSRSRLEQCDGRSPIRRRSARPELRRSPSHRALPPAHRQRHDDALSAYEKALALRPNLVAGGWAAARRRRAAAARRRGAARTRHKPSTRSFLGVGRGVERPLRTRPLRGVARRRQQSGHRSPMPASPVGGGNAAPSRLRRLDEALAAYDRAIALQPELTAWPGSAAAMSSASISVTTMPWRPTTGRWRSMPVSPKFGPAAAIFYASAAATTRRSPPTIAR